MLNKAAGKVRLTFKLEVDQLWIGTKGKYILYHALWQPDVKYLNFIFILELIERTEKVSMGSIKNVLSEPIEGHEDYHVLVSWNCSIV
jgi:hypothetical protein